VKRSGKSLLGKQHNFKNRDIELKLYPGEFENEKKWKEVYKKADSDYEETDKPEGTGQLYIKIKGAIVDAYDARGGPPYNSFKHGESQKAGRTV